MKQKKWWISFVAFILICLIVQVIGGFWTKETVLTWYPRLVKPSWTPPDWVFGPVWSGLYVMIAVSGWLVFRVKHSHYRTLALIVYGSQLALNFIWSFLFFSLCSPFLGLIDIVLLWILIMMTIITFWRLSPIAAYLLVPYFFWVTYAVALNFEIWLLN